MLRPRLVLARASSPSLFLFLVKFILLLISDSQTMGHCSESPATASENALPPAPRRVRHESALEALRVQGLKLPFSKS